MVNEKLAGTSSAASALTSSQDAALQELAHYALLHTFGLHKVEGIATRPYPLVIGPSGCGKTHLVKEFARQLQRPFFSLNIHNWIVRGARNDQQISLDQLAGFVRDNDDGVILIDEVNKLTSAQAGDSAWVASVLSEIIALLDMDERLDAMGLEGLRTKLRANFSIVGAAAFQDEWNKTKAPAIGFAGKQTCGLAMADFENAVRLQKLVPDELLYRFNDRLILLCPPTQAEFAAYIAALRAALRLPALSAGEITSLAAQAAASGKMMRWLEAYAADGTRLAEPGWLREIGSGQVGCAGEAESPSPARTAALERARRKAYDDAFTIYSMRLDRLATAAMEAAAVLKEISWNVLDASSRGVSWKACQVVLRQAHDAMGDQKKPNSLHEGLRRLSSDARQIAMPSTESDEERNRLAQAVDAGCEQIRVWLWKLVGPLNRELAGFRAMEIIGRFLDAAENCRVEYANLHRINAAGYHPESLETAGDIRLRWLLTSQASG